MGKPLKNVDEIREYYALKYNGAKRKDDIDREAALEEKLKQMYGQDYDDDGNRELEVAEQKIEQSKLKPGKGPVSFELKVPTDPKEQEAQKKRYPHLFKDKK